MSPDTAEGRARDREVHNRERTWIFCFCLDRSFSAQMGKPYTIKEEYVLLLALCMQTGFLHGFGSFVIRNAAQWCRSPVAAPADMALAAYAVRVADHALSVPLTPDSLPFRRTCNGS